MGTTRTLGYVGLNPRPRRFKAGVPSVRSDVGDILIYRCYKLGSRLLCDIFADVFVVSL
jgi:hypothetical protein